MVRRGALTPGAASGAISRAACALALVALTACLAAIGPTRRDDVRGYAFHSKLATAFRNCSPGNVMRKSETIYHVSACDQVAIYHCPEFSTIADPVCTLDAVDAAPVRRRGQPDPPAAVAGSPPSATQLGDADRWFVEGRALAKAEQHAEACVRFAQSDAVQHTFGTAVNLGDCAEREGHPGRAWRLYDDAARIAEHAGAASLAQFAHDRAEALAPKLCTVIVTIAYPAIPGLTIHIDERDIPPAREIHALVEPGRIEVIVAAPGIPGQRRTLYGAAGSVVSVAM
jgi:hypothetical protein